MEIAGVALLILLVAALLVYSHKKDQERLAKWQAWADQRGWTFEPGDDYAIAEYFEFVNRFRQGENRYAKDTLRGDLHGRQAVALTYHYERTSTNHEGHRDTTHTYLWLVGLQLEHAFPELLIAPEGMGKRLLHKFTGSDIDFESIEFSRSFEVKCANKRFAYDFCNTAMMENFLQNKDSLIELDGYWLVTYGHGELKLETVDNNLQWLNHLRSLMPEFLFRPDRPY